MVHVTDDKVEGCLAMGGKAHSLSKMELVNDVIGVQLVEIINK